MLEMVGFFPKRNASSDMDSVDRERFVMLLYRHALGREAAPEEIRHYASKLGKGTASAASLLDEFYGSAEFRSRQSEPLWVPPGHFYSPVVNRVEIEPYLQKIDPYTPPADLLGIRLDDKAMLSFWQSIQPILHDAPFGAESRPGLHYRFQNHSYSYADGLMLHAMIRSYQPKRIIEVGSGWSSACTIDTVNRYLDENCEVTFVEPYPDLLKEVLGDDQHDVRIIDSFVQSVDVDEFLRLESNDILFIDSTHVVKTGSDVCHEVFHILPRLKSGVIVHFHDFFWPFEYPKPWIVDDNRSWNEIYLLRAFLMDNDNWDILFFNDYFCRFHRESIEATYPDFLKNSGGAIWLRKR